MSSPEQQRLKIELEAIISEHERYGRELAEQAFLEKPRHRYDAEYLRPIIGSSVARVLVRELAARDLPHIFTSVAIELAVAGFLQRYYELALHNLPHESPGHEPPQSLN